MRKLPYHPNFVQYFMHRVVDDKLQIFLRQYSGTLGDLISQRQQSGQLFTPKEIVSILLDVSAGLRFLHKQNVIHRGNGSLFRVHGTDFSCVQILNRTTSFISSSNRTDRTQSVIWTLQRLCLRATELGRLSAPRVSSLRKFSSPTMRPPTLPRLTVSHPFSKVLF
jgi:hypothetical protein